MEGFTVAMALADALPVLFFAGSTGILAVRLESPLFIVGAVLTIAAGICKVLWKLILGISKKDIKWLNRIFFPAQISGFAVIAFAVAANAGRIPWPLVGKRIASFPAILFFLLWFVLMFFMGWFRKNRFDNSAKANWTAQIVNSVAQLSLLAGVCLA